MYFYIRSFSLFLSLSLATTLSHTRDGTRDCTIIAIHSVNPSWRHSCYPSHSGSPDKFEPEASSVFLLLLYLAIVCLMSWGCKTDDVKSGHHVFHKHASLLLYFAGRVGRAGLTTRSYPPRLKEAAFILICWKNKIKSRNHVTLSVWGVCGWGILEMFKKCSHVCAYWRGRSYTCLTLNVFTVIC